MNVFVGLISQMERCRPVKNRSRHLLLWKYEFKIDMWGDLFIIQVLAEGICIADIV